MNILYICDEYPPGQHGGIGTSVQALARQMVKAGHHVVVAGLYTLGYGDSDEFTDEGVNVYRFRLGMDSRWFEAQQTLPVRIARRLLKDTGMLERDIKKSMLVFQQQLEQLINKYHIDIIEMPDYNDYIKYCKGYVPFPKLSVPVVVKMNGSMTYFARETGKAIAASVTKMECDILNQATAVVAVSQYTAQKSAAYFDYDKPIAVLNNGIDTGIPVTETRNPNQVVFTGTLVAKKGIYQLAKAWNMVNESKPDARLVILGKGDQQKAASYLTSQAVQTVTFMGHVDAETLYRHLSASAISVFPSYAEAFALAPLEAMACGTAVINSNRTSGAELIQDGVDGLLVDPDDFVQIAADIIYLLTDNDAREMLAKNGTEKVRAQFDIEKIATQNLEFYKQF